MPDPYIRRRSSAISPAVAAPPGRPGPGHAEAGRLPACRRPGLVEDHHACAARPCHPGDGAGGRIGDGDVPRRHDAGVLQDGHGERDGAAHLLRFGADLARGAPGEPGLPGLVSRLRGREDAESVRDISAMLDSDDRYRRARRQLRGAGDRCLGNGAARDDEQHRAGDAGGGSRGHSRAPGIQSVPASGTLAIAAASMVSAARSSGSRLCTSDLPQARASMVTSMVSARR